MDIESYKKFVEGLPPELRKKEMAKNRECLTKSGILKRVPSKVYHVSPQKNRDSILENGLLSNFEGAIFCCPTLKDIETFINSKNMNSSFSNSSEYDIYEISTRSTFSNKWYKSNVHSKDLIKADAIVYIDNNISKSNIKLISI